MKLLMRPLFSGSKGNASYIQAGDVRLLVDAGVSCARLVSALNTMDVDPASLDAILISHEHSDHINGLDLFATKFGIKVYTNSETWAEMAPKLTRLPAAQRIIIDTNSDFCIRSLNIETYEKPHDAVRSLGFGFYTSGVRGAVVTDIGHMPTKLLARLAGCSMLLIESNYDEQMLLYGSYPEHLKRRIYGRNGHLSNKNCGETLQKLAAAGAAQVALMHLSEENNTPDRAFTTVEHLLSEEGIKTGRDIRLLVAGQDGPCEELSI
jgi:phosphoribosyl 1,2-cyclic phosphodiesterase